MRRHPQVFHHRDDFFDANALRQSNGGCVDGFSKSFAKGNVAAGFIQFEILGRPIANRYRRITDHDLGTTLP